MNEQELFFSGYCFQVDRARITEALIQDGKLAEADCLYETCDYRFRCSIGTQITEALEKAGKE